MCFTLLCARQLHNAQQDALEKNGVASATKDELDATKVRVETLSSQLQQYRKEVSWGRSVLVSAASKFPAVSAPK